MNDLIDEREVRHKPIMGVEIVGHGDYLPNERISNEELIEKYELDSSDEWIRTRTGIENRHIVANSKIGTTAIMAAAAGRIALNEAHLSGPRSVDSLILATTTQDRQVPATSATVQHLLGINASAYDVNAACSGFVFAAHQAYMRLAQGERRSLVIGAETLSRIVDWNDRSTAVLFGDGAGAVVLQETERQEAGLLGWHEITDGSLESILNCEHGGTLQMEGKSVYAKAVKLVPHVARKAMEEAGVESGDIALVVPHQANKRIVEAVSDRLGIGMDRMMWAGHNHANTSSASIPLALTEAISQKRLERGDLLLLAGFGAGMTAAASVIRY